jgi:glycosyltransferase involved in cell wall biosynthesis
MSSTVPLVSIVIPIYNELENLYPLASEIAIVMEKYYTNYELIFVDDGSSDDSWELIKTLSARDTYIQGLRFSRNFGHQAAILAGITQARGQAIITMDGDFQHPPSVIPSLIRSWQSGAHIVLTKRTDHRQTSFLKRTTSILYYKIHSYLSDQSIDQGSSDFRLIDITAKHYIIRFKYSEIFLRGAVKFLGLRHETISFTADKRRFGVSKFTVRKMLRLARGGLIAHSSSPLYMSLVFGTIIGCFGLVYGTYALIMYFYGITLPGWTSLIVLMLVLFAGQSINQGIIALYINDIHQLVKDRPQFIISETTINYNP